MGHQGGHARGAPRPAGAGDRAPQPARATELPPLTGLILLSLAVIAGLGCWLVRGYGPRQGALYAIGLTLGATLYHSRFGFSAAFRNLVSVGQDAGLRVHLLMLAAASALFAPILASGEPFFGVRPHGFVYPIGVDVAAGALLFGVGMQFAAACPAGALYDIGGGFIAMSLTLGGLMAGSVLGDWHWRFWTQQLPSLPPISLAHRLGYGWALPAQLAAFALIAAGAGAVRHRRRTAPPKRPRTDVGPARILRGAWAPWCGALVLAGLNAATLLIKGSPWGTTGAIALWGSKLAAGLGVPVGAWAYWSGTRGAALRAPVLADAATAMDLGLILGALLAAGAAGTFALRRPIPWPTALAATVGGTMMGYGAQVSGGCTVGAYFSGIASFSLHGWLWGALAIAGAALGGRLLPLLRLSPLRTDAADW